MLKELLYSITRTSRIWRGWFHRVRWQIEASDINDFFTSVAGIATVVAILQRWGVISSKFVGLAEFTEVLGLTCGIFVIMSVLKRAHFLAKELEFLKREDVDSLAVRCVEENTMINVGQQLWTERDKNRRIENLHTPIAWAKEAFSPEPIVRHFMRAFITNLKDGYQSASPLTFDSPKIRMKSELFGDTRDHKIWLQRSSYFKDRITNGLIGWKVKIGDHVVYDVAGRFFKPLPSNPNVLGIESLDESPLSNQLGASTILITRDCKIVALRQANDSAENRNKLAPSGSGSFDFTSFNLSQYGTIQQLVRSEAKRELIEECGLSSEDITDINICGFGRYIYRAGKPEFFCIARTHLDLEQINIPVCEWDYQWKERVGLALPNFESLCATGDKNGISSAFRDLASSLEAEHADHLSGNDRARAVSGPLIWNILLAADYVETMSSKDFKRLFH